MKNSLKKKKEREREREKYGLLQREKVKKISVKQQSLSSYINSGNEMVSQIPLNLQITKIEEINSN